MQARLHEKTIFEKYTRPLTSLLCVLSKNYGLRGCDRRSISFRHFRKVDNMFNLKLLGKRGYYELWLWYTHDGQSTLPDRLFTCKTKANAIVKARNIRRALESSDAIVKMNALQNSLGAV
jgi:hypothetical protein